MPSTVVIFGTGGFARALHFYLERDSEHEVVAHTATRENVTESTFSGVPLVPFDEVTDAFPPSQCGMFVAVGYRRVNRLRASYYHQAKALGYELISYVSSKADHWGDTAIGDNCCVLEGTIIEPFVTIGNDTILWSSSHVCHDSQVGDHCFMASQSLAAGFSRIGSYCFLGLNATVREGITLGEGCVIGTGATIDRETKPGEVYLGPRSEAYDGDTSRFLA